MTQNELQIKQNNIQYNQDNKITNINAEVKIDTVSKKYCAKCLSGLDDDRVVDVEGNEFCSSSCRRDYWFEIRQDMDDLISELS